MAGVKPEPSGAPSRPPRLLIIDDDPGQRSLLSSFLGGQGFEVFTASSGEKGLESLDRLTPIDMVISDVRMPGISGLETMRLAREKRPDLPVLMVTAYADIRDAVGAMRDGAINYLEKPIDLDELLACARQAIGWPDNGRSPIAPDTPLPGDVIACGPATRGVFAEVALVAPSEARVLITGESGVGKEVVADLLHRWSPRAAGRLIKVNCAAIPENLLESELFGHEKGAFTGATAQRIGRFEEADKGTILLDEIGEMPLSIQAKLLRVTQDGSFQRVGSNRDIHTNTRILAATNRDLEQLVAEGRFREDLFYRLNVVEIYMPTLRSRREDILPMAVQFASRMTGGNPRLSAAMTACLELYDWPGNVRELWNAMERATLMARGDVLMPEHLPKRIRQAWSGFDEQGDPARSGARMEDIERAVILQTLREKNYVRTETARALGISRRALIYKLHRFSEQGYAIDAPADPDK